MWTVRLPLSVPVSSRKHFHLNLNHYRNAHFQVLTKAKKAFDQEVKHLIQGIPLLRACTLEYVLYTGSRQLCDTNNICTVADKFFADTLVKHGVLEDDNYNLLVDTRFRFGAIDRDNPRVEVIIRSPDHIPVVPPEVVKESADMKIARKTSTLVTITEEDLKTAIREYVSKHVSVPENATVTIEEQEDYNYEVRLETDEPPTQLPLEVKENAPRRTRNKLEPKEAMAAVKASQTSTPPDHQSEPHQVSEPQQAAQETPKAAFLQAKDVSADNLTAEANLAAQAPFEGDVQKSQPEETMPPPPPAPVKAGGLFSAMKRPSNA